MALHLLHMRTPMPVIQSDALLLIGCCVVQLVAADARAEKVVHAHPASDMWALGVLAYEMFAG